MSFPRDVVRYAVVEDAVPHARSLCKVSIGSAEKDPISLDTFFPILILGRDPNAGQIRPGQNRNFFFAHPLSKGVIKYDVKRSNLYFHSPSTLTYSSK